MAQSLMIVATDAGTGKSVVSLGLLDQFERHGARACYFKPVGLSIDTPDSDAVFINRALGIQLDVGAVVSAREVSTAIKAKRYDEVIDKILEAHSRAAVEKDIVILEGVDSLQSFPSLESDINLDIAKNVDATLLLVTSARGKSIDDVVSDVLVARNQLQERGAEVIGVVINRVEPRHHGEYSDGIRRQLKNQGLTVFGIIPELPILSSPRVSDVVRALDAQILAGGTQLESRVGQVLVAAMGLENALHYFEDRCLIITPGDREEILLAAGASFGGDAIRPAAVVLTGGFEPRRKVMHLVDTLCKGQLPILRVDLTTYETALAINAIKPAFAEHQEDKALAIRSATEEYVDVELLVKSRFAPKNPVLTPRRFLRKLRDKCSSEKMTIVLPESEVERILHATDELRRRDLCNIILLGDKDSIVRHACSLGITFDAGVQFADPNNDEHFEDYVHTLLELRKHKGLPENVARDLMRDRTYFGTMMVYKNHAQGMVSGSTTTTQATLRPAFEFVRTQPGIENVSSVFLMALSDRVLVYGDCAVIPNPTAEQLAEIALMSAATARAFDIEPRVAMLSYSTGDSGKGKDVEKVREATEIVRKRAPELMVEGPIQYDAAVDPSVARTKLPDSKVAGQATVFVFPDLNTGNNTYKAVQRSSGAIAVGPILQGLRKPVNDLSRGATITDIVNTVVVTSIQAQAQIRGL